MGEGKTTQEKSCYIKKKPPYFSSNFARITASMVLDLRKMSGRSIMDCKKALKETNGDINKALSILRNKTTYLPIPIKGIRNGRVGYKRSENGGAAALAMLYCQTDFASRSKPFIETADLFAESVLRYGDDENAQNILENLVKGKKFHEILNDCENQIKEKIDIGNFKKYRCGSKGIIGTYIHFNNRLGSMIEVSTDNNEITSYMRSIVQGIAMHITAINPIAIDRDSIPVALIEKEKAKIVTNLVKTESSNISDDIVQSRIELFVKDNCLLTQTFIKDNDKTVKELLEEAAKKSKCEATIERFVRFSIE